ncbi:MAG: hypothetical protein JSV86_07080, partial [Gemmatimonadota bacterium]
ATTSFSTPLGSGDYAVYMGATGALADVTGNDVWQQGVGPASNSDVPTTDINGVTRSGTSCNPGAFEADGFVAPTVITKTIAASGADYATFTLAEAAVTSIGSGTDLTFYNEAIVFEADAGTYNESVGFSSTLVCDATRNVTYKPAAGSEHGGVPGAGVHLTSNTITLAIQQDYLTLEGLSAFSNGSTVIWQPNGIGTTVRNCIGETDGSYTGMFCGKGDPAAPSRWQNCVTLTSGTSHGFRFVASGSSACYAEVYNCTSKNRQFEFESRGPACVVDVVNCLTLGNSFRQFTSGGGAVTLTGSNNFGGSTDPFPAALQGSPYPITASTAYDPGAGDFALYVGKNGALLDSPNNDVIDQGVGPSANSDVPTTDILGNARSGATANPGAFEQPQATATITKTIGPSGRDYTTFTLAEADVTNIGGSADLVNENERIVFEADAADYSGNFQFFTGGGLTCDATRNVTWTHATGAGHGGEFESGANIVGYCLVQEDFAIVDGLSVSPSSGLAAQIANGPEGVVFRNLMAYSATSNAFKLSKGGTSASPCAVENCVGKSDSSRTFDIRAEDSGVDSHWRIVNTTAFAPGINQSFAVGLSSSDTLYLQLTNNVALSTRVFYDFGGATLVLTGSNNFGSNTFPFPAAIQGSPYPVTPTTDTDPGAGDWAIYETATGTLVFDSDNDVLLGGIGPASNSDVPTTDIVGTTRSGRTTDPGAFQVSPAGIGAFGIETEEAFGSPTLDATITVTAGRGIVSAEAFGTALIAGADLVVTGIASAEAFGRLVVEAGTQFRLDFQPDSSVVDVMTHVDAPLTTLTGQDRPIPGMVHTINYYAQHLGWSSDQTAA